MTNIVIQPALVEFLRWIDAAPRTYDYTMSAWRSSCPRLTLWEDASIGGLIALEQRDDDTFVVLTTTGRDVLTLS